MNSSVGFNGSRQTITLYSGSAITLTDLYFISQPGNGVCRLYDVTINGVEQTFVAGTGTNSFYLPFDGSAPIGQDQSGRGNNWTPVNFGGSNTIEKATGALPILNTDGGGKTTLVGVRSDNNPVGINTYCSLALPLVGVKSDFSASVRGSGNGKSVTIAGGAVAISTVSNFYNGSFKFDGTGDYLEIPGSADFRFETGDFTIEFWAYCNPTQATNAGFISYGDHQTSNAWAVIISGSTLPVNLRVDLDGSLSDLITTNTPIIANKWQHHAITRTGGYLNYYLDGVLQLQSANTDDLQLPSNNTLQIGTRVGLSGYDFSGYLQDVRIYKGIAKYTQNFIPASTDPDILPDTPSGVAYGSNVTPIPSTDGGSIALNGTGDYLKTVGASSDFAMGTGNFTIEMFIYPQTVAVYSPGIISWSSTEGTSGDYTNAGFIAYGSNGTVTVLLGTNSSYASIATPTSGPLLKFDSWNHIAIVRDTGNTFRVFVNGELAVTDTSTLASTNITAQYMNFGAYYTGTNYMVRGFISNVHVVKGTALYSSNFTPPVVGIASTTNTKLLFAKSGISTTATEVTPSGVTIGIAGTARVTNFNPFTSNINTQRGQESGYCTLNPLFPNPNGGTYSNGNLRIATAAGNGHYRANVGMSTGKWYWETIPVSGATPGIHGIGNDSVLPSQNPGQSTGSFGYYSETGYKQTSGTDSAYGSTYTYQDVIGCAYDASNGKIYWSKNGVWQGGGDPVAGTSAAFTSATSTPYYPLFCAGSSTNTVTVDVNFGQKPFKFPPPTGFQPLALANTPRPTIVRPDQYVGIVTYIGNGGTQSVSGYNFKPDLVWLKSRSNGVYYHIWSDSVRGVGNVLYSNDTAAEGTGYITSFDAKGFAVNVSPGVGANANNETYVAWCWKAGGQIGVGRSFMINNVGFATAGDAGMNAGTITPTGASVNTKSGFSIVTWTGNGVSSATISHGLNASPAFIITVSRDGGSNWNIYHQSLATNNRLFFTTSAAVNVATSFNGGGIGPGTSSVINFTQGTTNVDNANANNVRYVAYLWAEIPGFSKFGSYIGNSSTDGPVIITGFRPTWILIKQITSSGDGWYIYDTQRNKYNPTNTYLWAQGTNEDQTSGNFDILSNGFKLRTTASALNYGTTPYTYIYAAFAETPSFNLYGGQSNAR